MYLGHELSQADGFSDFAAAPFKAVLGSIMNSPLFTGLQEQQELISGLAGEEKSWEDRAQAYVSF